MSMLVPVFILFAYARRSSRLEVRGSNTCVGPQRWRWASLGPWYRMTFPDSALCHFTRGRASPFPPQQKVHSNPYACSIRMNILFFNKFLHYNEVICSELNTIYLIHDVVLTYSQVVQYCCIF